MKEIKPYSPSDLIWLKPIAKKYNELAEMQAALAVAECAMVCGEEAVMAIYPDAHGKCLAGLTDKAKAMLPIVPQILRWADDRAIRLHGHWTPGSWQAKLALQNGFYFDVGTYYRPAGFKRF
jgi:hypothetical protein